MARGELYEDGDPTNEQCPRCGDTYMADHGDRRHCGNCDYTEWE